MEKNANSRGSGRIVGGSEATPNDYPHLVALTIDGLYFCGGNVISENTILTAAHCTDGARSVEVTAGAHDQSVNEATQQIITSSDTMEHPDWNANTIAGDVSLIFLPEPLSLNEYVSPINLGSGEPPVGDRVTMAGWGKTCDVGCGVNDVVMEVTCPVLDDNEAEAYYGDFDWENIICIDSAGGMGTCNGDSGGPLMDAAGDLVGVTSFGSIFGCEVGAPACFRSVPSYNDWISENMRKH